MGKAAAEIKEMAAAENPSKIPSFAEVITERSQGGDSYDGKELTLQLARLEQHSQLEPELNLRSSMPVAGMIKRLYGKLAQSVLGPAFHQQSRYNMEIASCMWAMKGEMEQSQKQLLEKIRQLEIDKEKMEERLRLSERQGKAE